MIPAILIIIAISMIARMILGLAPLKAVVVIVVGLVVAILTALLARSAGLGAPAG